MEARVLPRETPIYSVNAESDVYVVKYNADGNYLMSGHTDRTVRVSIHAWMNEIAMERK